MIIYDQNKLYEIKNPDLSLYQLEYHKDENEEYLLCVPYDAKELRQKRIFEIKSRLESLSQDFAQAFAGAHIEDMEKRKNEFAALHNELRELLGKTPRIYY